MANDKTDAWVYVGSLPDTIAEGRHVAPGDEFVRTEGDAQEQLLEESGRIIPKPPATKLTDLSVPRLRDLAADRGIEVKANTKKDDLVALLDNPGDQPEKGHEA